MGGHGGSTLRHTEALTIIPMKILTIQLARNASELRIQKLVSRRKHGINLFGWFVKFEVVFFYYPATFECTFLFKFQSYTLTFFSKLIYSLSSIVSIFNIETALRFRGPEFAITAVDP